MKLVESIPLPREWTAEEIYAMGREMRLRKLCIVGYNAQNELTVVSNITDYPQLLYMLEEAKEEVWEKSKDGYQSQ